MDVRSPLRRRSGRVDPDPTTCTLSAKRTLRLRLRQQGTGSDAHASCVYGGRVAQTDADFDKLANVLEEASEPLSHRFKVGLIIIIKTKQTRSKSLVPFPRRMRSIQGRPTFGLIHPFHVNHPRVRCTVLVFYSFTPGWR